jgi:hypothetical protein
MSRPFWKDLFKPGGFAWSIKVRQGDLDDFFAPQDEAMMAERRRWLDGHPDRHLVETPEAAPMIAAAWELATRLGHVRRPDDGPADLLGLSRRWEPDLVFYDAARRTFAAACVCLPSSWDPRKWIGRPLDEVHDEVPRLQQQIGAGIDRFLDRLEPGRAFRRENWSLTHGGELNFHPALDRPKLQADTPLDEVFLRIEHQIFTGLPGGVMMGLRIRTCPLADLAADPEVWETMAEKIETMPDDVAEYKSLLKARDPLVQAMKDFIR